MSALGPTRETLARSCGVTPYVAAVSGIGANREARITRRRYDGTRCGLATGRHAAWNWVYEVEVDGYQVTHMANRSLVAVRGVAACYAARVVEAWEGGATFERGPKGGLTRVVAKDCVVATDKSRSNCSE